MVALAAHGVPSVFVALARLLERRELRSITVVLMDFFYQLARGQEPAALLRAHKRVAATAAAEAAAGKKAASTSSSSSAAVLSRARAPAGAAAAGGRNAPNGRPAGNDPLALLVRSQRSARELEMRDRMIADHGGMRGAVVLGGADGAPAGVGIGRTAPHVWAEKFRAQAEARRAPAARRRHAGGRKSKDELPQAPLGLDLRSGIGASLLSGAVGGGAAGAVGGGLMGAGAAAPDGNQHSAIVDAARNVRVGGSGIGAYCRQRAFGTPAGRFSPCTFPLQTYRSPCPFRSSTTRCSSCCRPPRRARPPRAPPAAVVPTATRTRSP